MGGLPILPVMAITSELYSRVVWRDLAYLALGAAMFALAWQPYDTWQARYARSRHTTPE